MVSSKDGWMPSGTSCSADNQSFCILGKCLQFGQDKTPAYESISEEIMTDIKRMMIKPRSLRQGDQIGLLIANWLFLGWKHFLAIFDILKQIELF